jgi:hypothetical protein
MKALNRSRYRQNAALIEGALPFVAASEPVRFRPPGIWTTPPIIPEAEATVPHHPNPWRTPPLNPGAAWSVSPVAARGPVSGDLPDPIESLDPPVCSGKA